MPPLDRTFAMTPLTCVAENKCTAHWKDHASYSGYLLSSPSSAICDFEEGSDSLSLFHVIKTLYLASFRVCTEFDSM